MKAAVEKATGATAIFMQSASGDMSANAGPNKGYEAFGEALGNEVVKLAASLTAHEVVHPSLVLREERLKFASRTDLSNPVTRAAYAIAFFPELVANYADEYTDGVRPRLTVALLNGEIAFVSVFVGVVGHQFRSEEHTSELQSR